MDIKLTKGVVDEILLGFTQEQEHDRPKLSSKRNARIHHSLLRFEQGFNLRKTAKAMLKPGFINMVIDIARRGVKSPITVEPCTRRKAKDKRPRVIAGHLRACAMSCAEYFELRPAEHCTLPFATTQQREIDGDDEFSRTWENYAENVFRMKLTPIERAHAYKKMVKQLTSKHRPDSLSSPAEAKKWIATGSGESVKTINRYLTLLKLPGPIQEAVEADLIPLKLAFKLAGYDKNRAAEIAARYVESDGEVDLTITEEVTITSADRSQKPKSKTTSAPEEEQPEANLDDSGIIEVTQTSSNSDDADGCTLISNSLYPPNPVSNDAVEEVAECSCCGEETALDAASQADQYGASAVAEAIRWVFSQTHLSLREIIRLELDEINNRDVELVEEDEEEEATL